ncbi:AglZ/HisF2 family acetamidino modification protein [uncultured Roseivirga sp.]|mgnify:CR=1 FL=1|uniref:AglZ/HisF2 family acetamidino modification protein n=1 Tax=uncultured Roseivirga sp. TaxID=543088 RepID=UPI0030DABB0B|tara:strand:- start:84450 stop:85223 length:774 start_codon:yes stop_codon:yes gene_type:complete
MLRSRITPVLLIHNNGLVKTVQFKAPKYVGDPLNAVRIFNEKEVDELIVVDIDKSSKNLEPDFGLIERLAIESRMPLCYGGGIKTPEQAQRLVNLGVEKVAISSAIINEPNLVREMSEAVGQQSIVAVLDIKKTGLMKKYRLFTLNGTKESNRDPFDFALELQSIGIGEILVNAIDQEGTMTGYDNKLNSKMRDLLDVPITFLGGAGSLSDIKDLVQCFGPVGAGAGSIFVFKGKYRAVLINYPNEADKHSLYNHYK